MQGFFCQKKVHGFFGRRNLRGVFSVKILSSLLIAFFSGLAKAGTVHSFPSQKNILCDSVFKNAYQEKAWEKGTLFGQEKSLDSMMTSQTDFFQASEEFQPHLDYKNLLKSFESPIAAQKLSEFRDQIQAHAGVYKNTILQGESRASVFPIIQKKARAGDREGLQKFRKDYSKEYHVDVTKDRYFVSAIHLALLDSILSKNIPMLELFLEHDEFPLSILVLKRLKEISSSLDVSKDVSSQWDLILRLYEKKATKLVEKLKPVDALYPDIFSYFAEKWVFQSTANSSVEVDVFLKSMLQSLDKSSLQNSEVQKYLLKALHRLFLVSSKYSVNAEVFERLQKIFRSIHGSVELQKSRSLGRHPVGMEMFLSAEASDKLGYLTIEFFWDQLSKGYLASAIKDVELSKQWMEGFRWIALYEAQGLKMRDDFLLMGSEYIQKMLARPCVEWLLPRLR